MFERFTEPARRALYFARHEASELGATSIAAEHLLLALLREPGPVLPRVFEAARLSPEAIRGEIEHRSEFREKIPTSVEIPFNKDAKRALEHAVEGADRLGHPHIGPEHLLLGLLCAETSAAASILTSHGMQVERVHEMLADTPSETPPPSAAGLPPDAIRDISERLDRIGRLVQQLDRRFSDDREAHVLFERLNEELAALQAYFAG